MSKGEIRFAARCHHGCSDFEHIEQARSSARRWIELGTERVYIEKWTSNGEVFIPEHVETIEGKTHEPE